MDWTVVGPGFLSLEFADPAIGEAIEQGLEQGLAFGDVQRRSITLEFQVDQHNRAVIELFHDVCLGCKAMGRRDCTCHDDGKGMD